MRKIVIILSLFCCTLFSLMGQEQTYKVGDLYTAPDGSQGIVYYLCPDGSGGWVVALTDASSGCAWGANADVPGLTNLNPTYTQNLMSDTAGYAHTQALRNYQNNSATYAAGKVDFAHGWVLPSPAQLATLYGQLPLIASALISAGGTTLKNNYYWTSAEKMSGVAWLVDFGYENFNGAFVSSLTTYSYPVRAVRSFTYESYVDLNYVWSTGANTPDILVSPSQTTTYTVTVSSSDGRTGMGEKTIVVGNGTSTEYTIVTSEPYVWDGVTYNYSGDYTRTYIAANGCDSVVTLHLTVTFMPKLTATSDTICAGDEVNLFVQAKPVYVGDILCSDNTIVNRSEWPVADKTAVGIVFHVDATGRHGWAVNIYQQATSITWAGNGWENIDIPDLDNALGSAVLANDMDGYAHTQLIRSLGDANAFPAAYAVDFENGWYIPSSGQLRLLYAELLTINTSLQLVGGTVFRMDNAWELWSSNEQSQNRAYTLSYSGTFGGVVKYNQYGLRSIRAF